MKSSPRGRIALLLSAVAAACAVGGGAWARVSSRAPTSRLASGAHYPQMPPDETHRYLDLPVDHAHPESGSFRDFYILSPRWRRGDPVVFFLTDGQMELVGPRPDMGFFDAQLPGLSYVLIGHRGHSPTLFPEVYADGRLDLRRALDLYGSWQRVEDIERVRLDMSAQGLLPADGKVMVYGASGAGVLAQQYLDRHGEHVSRALLSVTGAPDLAARRGVESSRDFSELDPRAARMLDEAAATSGVSPASLAYMVFQLGRQGLEGRAAQRRVLESLTAGDRFLYRRLWLQPRLNFPLCRVLLGTPTADAVRVRMFELMGTDLRRRAAAPRPGIHPLYAWASSVLADYLAAGIAPPPLAIDRSRFAGEVLVVSALDDVVFSPSLGREIARAYRRSRFLAVEGGHRLTDDAAHHAAVRRAFFREGLGSPEVRTLLSARPMLR